MRQNLPGRFGSEVGRFKRRRVGLSDWPATCVVNGNVAARMPECSGQKLPPRKFRKRIQ